MLLASNPNWIVPPTRVAFGLVVVGAVVGYWWFRDRRLREQHKRMRLMNALGEEVIASKSPAEILRKLSLMLPKLSFCCSVNLYVYNRVSRILESVQAPGDMAPVVVDVDAPEGPGAGNLAMCVRNHTLISIPDTRRSPFWKTSGPNSEPRSMMLIPMLAQNEPLGVLELLDPEHIHAFTPEEQAAMQHLANQIATALKLQEQQSIREQLFRSEKLAAAGQLISGVANELQSPLVSIVNLTKALLAQQPTGAANELKQIGSEAQRAAELVARLVSFGRIEKSEAIPVDLTQLLVSLLEFRAHEFKQKGIEVKQQLSMRPLTVLGSQGQLEQVLLNLLVEAEHAAADSKEKTIVITSGLLARRVLIEISYATRFEPWMDGSEDVVDPVDLGLTVCRGIVQSHGGDFRTAGSAGENGKFEIEFPALEVRDGAQARPISAVPRQLTILLIEPDLRLQRQTVEMLSNRGDRVIPVTNGEEGVDLTHRIRFDLAICEARLPGWSWVEFFDRVRNNVHGFVLLTDGYSPDLARAFQGGEGFVLTKPIDESNLHRICQAIEERTTMRS